MFSIDPNDRLSREPRGQKSKKMSKSIRSKWGRIFGFLLTTSIWMGFFGAGAILWFSYDLPNTSRLENSVRRAGVTLLARDGSLIATYGDLYGHFVPVDKMPPHVFNAVLATEDRRFWRHFGVDILGIARAAWVNYRAKSVVQGGSTITQQLAKNFLLSEKLYTHTNRSYRRKIQEVLLALWLEMTFSKKQILSIYLNRVYFGSGVYGVDGAARKYFKKGASSLTLYESALLAGLLKAPSKYSPHSNPTLAHNRALTVLSLMRESNLITEHEFRQNKKSMDQLDKVYDGSLFGRYFADWVFDSIDEYVGKPQEDLVVVTTLDPHLQRIAEEKTSLLFEIEGPKNGAHQMALVSMTPDGGVRALLGGADYKSSQFNRATQAKRQTGSAFKLFVFLSAIEQGYKKDTQINDTPLRIGKWQAKNYHWQPRGHISMIDAFAYSVNTATIRLAQKMGIKRLSEIALRLGLISPQPSDLTIALGSGQATLLELTAAYAAVANHGFGVWPYGISMIKTSAGKVIYQRKNQPSKKILQKETILTILPLMMASLTYGTGKSAYFGRPIAGKTGTSQNYKDAWTVGFTPDLVTGVWVGNDQNQSMNKITGGKLPARLWKMFMESAHHGKAIRGFPVE